MAFVFLMRVRNVIYHHLKIHYIGGTHQHPAGTLNESDICNGFQKFLIGIFQWESMRIFLCPLSGGDENVAGNTGKLEDLSQN